MSSTVSTHVLDTARGAPAPGMLVRLERADGAELGRGRTDDDGRISGFGVAALRAGTYRLVFETGRYLTAAGDAARDAARDATGDTAADTAADAAGQPAEPPFFPEVIVTFSVDGRRPGYHVPLLLSPYSYATYRGS